MARATGAQELQRMTNEAIVKYANFLGINNPLIVKYANVKKYYGKYETEIVFANGNIGIIHLICISTFYNGKQKTIESTVAHELVHARQAELGYDLEHEECPFYRAMQAQIIANFGIDIEERD